MHSNTVFRFALAVAVFVLAACEDTPAPSRAPTAVLVPTPTVPASPATFVEPTAVLTATSSTMTPTSQLIVTPVMPTEAAVAQAYEQDGESKAIVQVASGGRYFSLAWTSDSSALFFGPGYRVYDVATGTERQLSPTDPLRQTPTPEIASQLPADAIFVNVSPGGKEVLYLTLLSAQATSTPDMDAGEHRVEGTLELWLLDESGEYKIGELEYCDFEAFLWTSDGKKAIIAQGPTIGSCGDAYAWSVDLRTHALDALFPLESFHGVVYSYDLSPDGQWLLYGVWDTDSVGNLVNPLYAFNLETHESVALGTPDLSHGKKWLTDQVILISYSKETSIFLTLGLFDIETGELTELTPQFEGSCIRLSNVSPNGRWLAFAVGKAVDYCDILDQIWLLDLVELSPPG